VHVDGPARRGPGITPDLGHQVLARDDRRGLRDKQVQEIEFLAGEADGLPVQPQFPAVRIQCQRAMVEQSRARPAGADPAHDGLDTGYQLTEAEGLDQAVVRPGLQGEHPVDLLVAFGDGDDRHVGIVPDRAAHLEAVDVGKFEVQQHQVGRAMHGERVSSRLGLRHVVAVPAQVARERVGIGGVCSDYEYVHVTPGIDGCCNSSQDACWLGLQPRVASRCDERGRLSPGRLGA